MPFTSRHHRQNRSNQAITLPNSGDDHAQNKTMITSLPAGVAGLASVLAAVAFVTRQRGKDHSLLPLRLFSSKALSGGVAATFLLYAAMYGVVFFLPQYLHAALGLGTLSAGLGLLPWTGAFAVLSPFAGRLVDHYGERNMALAGMAMQVVGYASLAAACVSPCQVVRENHQI